MTTVLDAADQGLCGVAERDAQFLCGGQMVTGEAVRRGGLGLGCTRAAEGSAAVSPCIVEPRDRGWKPLANASERDGFSVTAPRSDIDFTEAAQSGAGPPPLKSTGHAQPTARTPAVVGSTVTSTTRRRRGVSSARYTQAGRPASEVARG